MEQKMSPFRFFLMVMTILVYVFMLAPVLVVIVVAFNPAEYVDFPITGVTLRWFREVLADPQILESLWISFKLGISSAIIATAIGASAAYVLARYKVPFGETLQLVLLMPLLIPHLIMGVGLLLAWRLLGLPRNFMLLLVGHVAIILPIVVLVTRHRFASISPSLEAAARTLGANSVQTFMSITLPLVAPALVVAFLYSFMSSFDELTATLFWRPVNTETVTTQIMGMLNFSTDHRVNALATILIILSFVVPLAGLLMVKLVSVILPRLLSWTGRAEMTEVMTPRELATEKGE
ncbi:ABC transporter permease [Hyphomicrobiales bacterium]|nr:ABC transporter permease [Hyphomicrobiales bacterium]CAH1691343.1 ABC transporter permease [Hyphomicrobiales bacterium]